MTTLLTIAQAAERLGLPEKPLAKAALAHGFLIRIGAQSRIMESEIGELLEKCRCREKVPDLSCGNVKDATPSGSSKTQADMSAARAQEALSKLKKPLLNTSQPKTAARNRPNQKK